MAKVTGIGGVFFKANDPAQLKQWYVQHLGLPETEDGYIVFSGDHDPGSHSVWSAFPEATSYFAPSKQPFMINFRVDDLSALLVQLEKEGITIVGEMEEYEYGKFGWILDPEGNKIELWEPHDPEFRKINKL